MLTTSLHAHLAVISSPTRSSTTTSSGRSSICIVIISTPQWPVDDDAADAGIAGRIGASPGAELIIGPFADQSAIEREATSFAASPVDALAEIRTVLEGGDEIGVGGGCSTTLEKSIRPPTPLNISP